jgi:hypothetical protein
MTILNPEHLGVRPWQQSENAKIRQEIVLSATPLRRHWLADPFRLDPRCIRTHTILAFQLSCLSSPKTVIVRSCCRPLRAPHNHRFR